MCSLQWHLNERHNVSNHRHPDCLISRLFRRTSSKHQSSASLAFVRNTLVAVDSTRKGPVTRKMLQESFKTTHCRSLQYYVCCVFFFFFRKGRNTSWEWSKNMRQSRIRTSVSTSHSGSTGGISLTIWMLTVGVIGGHPLKQNGGNITDDNFKENFVNKEWSLSTILPLKSVPCGLINENSSLF